MPCVYININFEICSLLDSSTPEVKLMVFRTTMQTFRQLAASLVTRATEVQSLQELGVSHPVCRITESPLSRILTIRLVRCPAASRFVEHMVPGKRMGTSEMEWMTRKTIIGSC